MSSPEGEEFRRLAKQRSRSALGDLWGFLRVNKKWWLAPIVIVLVVIATLGVMSASSAGPFIYTIF